MRQAYPSPDSDFLATAPAGALDRRAALAIALLSAVVLAVVMPIVGQQWSAMPAFIPAYQSAAAILDVVTAALLLGQFRELRRTSILLLACGYIATALLVVAHALSFPGAFAPSGGLVGGAQTTVWLWLAWHVVFPCAVIGYALTAARESEAGGAPSGSGQLAVLLAVALAGAAVLAATLGHDRLPALLDGNRYIPGVTRPTLAVPLVLSLVALAALVARTRLRRALDLWLAVAMGAWAVEILLSAVLNSGRFQAGFYVGRLYGLLAAGTVLVSLLMASAAAHGQLARTAARERAEADRALQESEARLRRAQEAGEVGAWEVDLSTGLRRWSKTTYRLWGIDPGTPVTLDLLLETVHPEDRERVRALVARPPAVAGRMPEVEFRIRRPSDGATRWLVSRYEVGSNPATGEPVGTVGIMLDTTARREAEAALRESEERHRLVIESARDFAIVTMDPGGVITGWNSGAERLMGHTEAEAVGQPGGIFFTPEDRAAGAPEEEMRLARELGRAEDERWHLRRDGTRFWGSGLVQPLVDGRRRGYVKIFQDRTAAREAREALRAGEAYWRGIFEQLHEGLLIGEVVRDWTGRGVDWRITETNAAWERLIGIPREAALGRTVREVVPGIEEVWVETWVRVAETGESVTMTQQAEALGRWYQAHGFRLGPDRFGVLFLDVTAQRHAEAAQARAAEDFRTLADNISQFAWMAEPDGSIFWYNRRWFDYTGTTIEEMRGWGWRAVHHPDHVKRVVAQFSAAIAAGEAWEDTFPLRDADGGYRWFLSRALPIRDDEGRILRWFGTNTDITELRETEEAMRASEERYRALVRTSAVIVWRAGPDGAVLDAPGWPAFTGQPDPDYKGTGWHAMVHPDDLADIGPAWVEGVANAVETETIHRLRHVSGGWRWVHARGVPLRDPDGTVREWVGTLTDIHDRREAEEALRKSEARHRRTLEIETVAVVYFDMVGGITDANDAFLRLIGYTRAELEAGEVRYENLTPPDWTRRDEQTIRELLTTGHGGPSEKEYFRRDGSRMWILCASKMLDERTAVEFVIDVTERKAGEAALRESGARLRELNETLETRVAERTAERDRAWRLSQDLLVVAEADGSLAAVNAAWTTLLGWQAEELVGHRFAEFTHPDDLDATLAAFAGIFEAPLTEPYEYRLRHSDGSYRWFAWTAAFEDGKVYASGRHTTAERQQAAALAAAQEALRQAQKMEAVGQLTGGIAHDFNNMLQGVAGGLDFARRRIEAGRPADALRYLDAAREASGRAATLTRRLLAFARRQPLEARPVELDALVVGLAELVRRTVGPQVAVELRLDGGNWPTLCDPNQLESALLNLAINARDAMPDGGRLTIATRNVGLGHVDLAGHEDVSPGDFVEVAVIDTGGGMPPEVLARAFEPFFTTKPIGRGTGLGLSQVYGFMRQSGGLVRLESGMERGTTVRLLLPLHTGASVAARPEPSGDVPRTTDGTVTGRVLLVEDEAAVRAQAAEALREAGCKVMEAADGDAALALLRAGPAPDALVTDVGLPGVLNGRQLAEAAREMRPELPVLFITGYAGGALGDVLPEGMSVISKPFALDTLVGGVRRALARRTAPAMAVETAGGDELPPTVRKPRDR